MSSQPPSLGKYQTLEEIGRGGMGAVYKGYDPFLDRTVAIKLLAPHLVWEKAFLERFLREARAAAKLQHPNVIPIYDVGQDGNNYYFVMAYLPGPSLRHLIAQKGRFTPTEALPILHQLANALDYAHSKGLIHRDVKPANVMFNEHDQVVLTDFGIVKAAEESRLTATGTSIGTPQYMAPEQIQGGEVDARVDVYAFGIIAFEILTGRVPFDAANTTAILFKHVNEPPPSATACCPDLPLTIEAALNHALAKSPADRYSSCGEFVKALEQALSQSAAQPQPKPAAEPDRKSRPVGSVTPPPSTSATRRTTLAPTAPPVPKRGIPGWVWAVAGGAVLVICLLAVGIITLASRQLTMQTPTPVVMLNSTTPVPPSATLTSVPSTVAPTPQPALQAHLVLWTKEEAALLDSVNRLVKEFEAQNPGITIEVVQYKLDPLRQNFIASAQAGAGPDLLWTVNDHTGPFVKAGVIQAVDNLGFEMNSFVPSVLEAVKLEGKTWGIPLSAGNHLMLMYNKKLIKEPPQDTDELIKAARDLTRGDVYGLVYSLNESYWLLPWLGGYGGAVFAADGKTPSLNTKAMQNALQLVYDFKFKYQIVPQECSYGCSNELFTNGKAAMAINGEWALGDYARALGNGLGIAPLPKIVGADWPRPYASGTYFMFPKTLTGDKLEAAKRFVNYALSDKVQLSYAQNDKHLPSINVLFNAKFITDDPILSGSKDSLSHSTGSPPQAEMVCIWDALGPNLEAVMTDKMRPAAAAFAMQAAAEKCVAEIK